MKSSKSPPRLDDLRDDDDESLAQRLAALTLATVGEDSEDLRRLLKSCLLKKKDEALYDALDRVQEADADAWLALRERVEELAGTVITPRGEQAWETNAFAIPLLVRSTGGLDAALAFQDQAAFEALRESMLAEGLEGPKARVALVAYAYHPDEAAALTYGDLQAMVREAAANLVDGKMAPAPALEQSMRGWPARDFAAQDEALELRFLLGFASKKLDDPFYRIPAGEQEAEAYFDARAERFRAWTIKAAPLLSRCLANDGRVREVNCLYQDLFFGARDAGLREYGLIELLAVLDAAIAASGHAPAELQADIEADEDDSGPLLAVTLRAGETELAHATMPCHPAAPLDDEAADLADALAGLGLTQIFLADQ